MNRILMGMAGMAVILLIAFRAVEQPSRYQYPHRRRRVRVANRHRRAGALRAVGQDRDRGDVARCLQPAGLCRGGNQFHLRAAGRSGGGGQQLRHRRAARHHFLFGADFDPLLSEYHAVHHQMGGRRDSEKSPVSPRSKACARRPTSSSGKANRRWSSGPIWLV